MRAISLWQPWATLWLLSDPDEKLFETRHWYTGYRGPLLVHASKKLDSENRGFIHSSGFEAVLERHGLTLGDLSFGAIIGRVELVSCRRMDSMPPPSYGEEMWGNWTPERFAWERGPNPRFIDQIRYKGQQGFFEVPDSLLP